MPDCAVGEKPQQRCQQQVEDHHILVEAAGQGVVHPGRHAPQHLGDALQQVARLVGRHQQEHAAEAVDPTEQQGEELAVLAARQPVAKQDGQQQGGDGRVYGQGPAGCAQRKQGHQQHEQQHGQGSGLGRRQRPAHSGSTLLQPEWR